MVAKRLAAADARLAIFAPPQVAQVFSVAGLSAVLPPNRLPLLPPLPSSRKPAWIVVVPVRVSVPVPCLIRLPLPVITPAKVLGRKMPAVSVAPPSAMVPAPDRSPIAELCPLRSNVAPAPTVIAPVEARLPPAPSCTTPALNPVPPV